MIPPTTLASDSNEMPAAATTCPSPVDESRRIHAVDVLRGVAVLGILAMNITTFGLPMASYMNPAARAIEPYAGPFSGLNKAAWIVQHAIFDMKMMTIFSMLFGAGLVLMAGHGRDESAGEGTGARRFAGVYYRRLGWLLVIGLVHAYIIWYGDILTTYALCGLMLYPLRRLAPRWLVSIGIGLSLVAIVISVSLGALMSWVQREAGAAEAAIAAGGEPSADQAEMLKAWRDANRDFEPSEENVASELARVRGPLASVIGYNFGHAVFFQTVLFFTMSLWRCAGGMFIGMALMKLGVLSAARSRGFYIRLAAAGYGLGGALVAVSVGHHLRHGFGIVEAFGLGGQWNYIGSFGVALGHVAAVMLLVKSGMARGLVAGLGAVGRMALTNYLSQSLIGAAVFFGWGFGLFGTMLRWQLLLVVLGIWALQLAWSPWWLARFRFGPAEWLWRSLTYGRVQAMRRG